MQAAHLGPQTPQVLQQSFNGPIGITTDGTNLYVADFLSNRIRKIVISTGVVTTLAGSSQGSTDTAHGTSPSFFRPRGITTDGTNLYVSEYRNHRIRKIVISTGVVTTLQAQPNNFGHRRHRYFSKFLENPME